MSAVFDVLLLVFFATLFWTLGFGCVCIGMSGSRILLPSYFTRGLPRVLCNKGDQASNLPGVNLCFSCEESATINFQGRYTSRRHMQLQHSTWESFVGVHIPRYCSDAKKSSTWNSHMYQ